MNDSELNIIKFKTHNNDQNTSKAEKALVFGEINNRAYNTEGKAEIIIIDEVKTDKRETINISPKLENIKYGITKKKK
jgi:hypothetical protein